MDVCLLIKKRLEELGLEQRDLAAAAQVTESYISQLLTRKKAPPAVERTDVYERMNTFLKLPKGQLSAMVEAERREQLKRKLADQPAPLFKEVRAMVIRKCKPETQDAMRDIFEKQAFSELERLVTQKLLDVTKRVAKDELKNESWLRTVAKLQGRSYDETRAVILEFLDTDVFSVSPAHCSAFMDPLIESWDLHLETFEMEVSLNTELTSTHLLKFQFVEMPSGLASEEQPGFEEFLHNPALVGNATDEEIEFLRNLRIKHRRPTPLYYYRELQNLRDPLHFGETIDGAMAKRRDADGVEKRMQLHSRKNAIERWAKNKVKPRSRKKSKTATPSRAGRKDVN